MLFFDKNIHIKFGKPRTGKKNGIIVYTTHKKYLFETLSRNHFFEFLDAIICAIEVSPFVISHRFTSSSPIRLNNDLKAYVNGKEYYQDLYEALNKASNDIFIRGWWICPELYLKRPKEDHEDSRLDRV